MPLNQYFSASTVIWPVREVWSGSVDCLITTSNNGNVRCKPVRSADGTLKTFDPYKSATTVEDNPQGDNAIAGANSGIFWGGA